MAITKLNSLAIPDNTIVEADLSYPLTNFSSTGIDDNATSTAITIDATEQVSTASHILAGGNLTVGTDGTVTGAEGAQIDLRGNDGTATQMYLDVAGSFNRMFTVSDNVNFQLGQLAGTGGDVQFFAGGSRKAKFDSDGLKFNNDTAAANALDDYEEGTWTPVLSASGGGSFTYFNQHGFYTKVGNIVHLTFWIQLGAPSSPSGNAHISGIPFAVNGSARPSAALRFNSLPASANKLIANYAFGSIINLQYYSADYQAGTLTGVPTSWFGSGDEIGGTITYRA